MFWVCLVIEFRDSTEANTDFGSGFVAKTASTPISWVTCMSSPQAVVGDKVPIHAENVKFRHDTRGCVASRWLRVPYSPAVFATAPQSSALISTPSSGSVHLEMHGERVYII